MARWSGGCWNRAPAAALRGVSTHSAKVLPGSLFISLKGPRHDAHAFVPQALAAGCAAALVRGDYVWPAGAGAEPPLLRAADPNAALGRLASGYRDAVASRVIGITGSAGKTTVKEMTAALLAALGPTACTPGNLNNEFGLPLSLLAMPRDTRYGVFEVGMSHPGELAPLCALLRPDCGIVTTVGPVHLEAFGSVRDIAREKAALLRALPSDGIAVLDRDQEWFADMAGQAPCPVTDVSCRPGAEFVLEGADPLEGVLEVRERGAARAERLHIGCPGAHNLRNALLAAALARRLGAGWEAIREALPRARRLPMRWECSDWNGVRIVNDAYNANPLGMRCALDTRPHALSGAPLRPPGRHARARRRSAAPSRDARPPRRGRRTAGTLSPGTRRLRLDPPGRPAGRRRPADGPNLHGRLRRSPPALRNPAPRRRPPAEGVARHGPRNRSRRPALQPKGSSMTRTTLRAYLHLALPFGVAALCILWMLLEHQPVPDLQGLLPLLMLVTAFSALVSVNLDRSWARTAFTGMNLAALLFFYVLARNPTVLLATRWL